MDVMENIEIELTDEEFLGLARQAHDLDVTFNQLVNKILGDAIGIDPAHQRFQHTVEQIMATS
jgi:hypothetical protein